MARAARGDDAHRHAASVRVAMGRCGVQAWCSRRTKRLRRTVKSCGPGAATLASIRSGPCRCGNGGKKGRSPGRARSKPTNHCAGKAGMSRLYLSKPCAFFTTHCTRCLRVPPAPGLPCALLERKGKRMRDTRAETCCGNEIGCLKATLKAHRPVRCRPGLGKGDLGSKGDLGRDAGGDAKRSPLLTIFWHCGAWQFSSRTARRGGRRQRTVNGFGRRSPDRWVWQC